MLHRSLLLPLLYCLLAPCPARAGNIPAAPLFASDLDWPAWPLAGATLLLGVLSAIAWQARRHSRRLEAEIRERMAAEERERAARNLLQSVLDAIPSQVFWKDRDSRYLGCNARCASDAGLRSPEDIIGCADHELAWAEYAEAFRADDLQVMESGQAKVNYESSAMASDGRMVRFNATKVPLFGSRGEIIGLVGAYRDITGHKQAENRLRLLASVFENSHEGIIITDQTATIVDVNQAFIELTGYTREEVIGRKPNLLKSCIHGEEFYAAMWQDLRTHGHWRGEIHNRRKDGEPYVELLDISAVRGPDGRIGHYVGIFSDITRLKEHECQLEQMAHYDALTRLPNRVLLARRLGQALAAARQSGGMLAVAYLDLDGFKPVNDTLGHEAGDLLLMAVSDRLKHCMRDGETVARLGGDEFVILLSELDSTEDCCRTMDLIIGILCEPYRICEEDIRISASIGVSLFPMDDSDPDTLMRHADQAMYTAKQSGRNRYHIFNPDHDRRLQDQMERLSRIEAALHRNEFVLYYQPKIDMRRNLVTGAEALIRWEHPERGLLLPAEFLPAVENRDFSVHLGRWVLLEAVRQLESWWNSGLSLKISINISARHLQDEGFVDDIRKALESHPGVPPTAVELEVLETMALEDMAGVSRVIRECRSLGVQFALDDFGTGYSSLTYFKRLPLDTLKIDQSFVKDMLLDSENHAIVEGVIALAHAFNRRVVAEGVESIEHGQVLMRLGCDQGQGYGIAYPMPATALPDWARNFAASPPWKGTDNATEQEEARAVVEV